MRTPTLAVVAMTTAGALGPGPRAAAAAEPPANPPAQSVEGQIAELTLEPVPLGAGRWSWSLSGHVLGGLTGARTAASGVGAGAALVYDLGPCKLVDTRLELTLSRQAQDTTTAGEHWLSACLVAGLEILPSVELGHHLSWQTTPSLAAPRRGSVRAAREELWFAFVMVDLPLERPDERLQFFRAVPTVLIQDGRPNMGLDFEMVRAVGRGGVMDVLHVEIREETHAQDVFLGAISPLRVRDWRVGPLTLDLDGHFILGGIWDPAEHLAAGTGAPGEHGPLRDVNDLGGQLGVRAGGARLGGGALITRAMWPGGDDTAVRETRASAWISASHAGFTLTLEGFGARTLVMPADPAGDAAYATGGGTLSLTRPLGHGLQAAVTAEAGRSFHAGAGADAAGAPAWGVRAFAVLSARIGRDR